MEERERRITSKEKEMVETGDVMTTKDIRDSL